jgi:hypothetical protein
MHYCYWAGLCMSLLDVSKFEPSRGSRSITTMPRAGPYKLIPKRTHLEVREDAVEGVPEGRDVGHITRGG